MFSVVDLFGMKQETIDWDKTAKNDFEGSINIEVHSGSLDSRLSKNTLVCKHKRFHENIACIIFLYLYKYFCR